MMNNEGEVGYNPMPMIGDKAPEFRAMTTKGKVNFPQDYSGSWVVLFSHPADFTPVCTTEFIGFSKLAGEFEKINTKLIGLSIDSLHSHLAWARSVENIDLYGEGKVEVSFPIIADISMDVAKKYGMIQTVARTQTVRAVFIIDPEGVIRTILYYPMSTGRNLPEILRILQSLQLHDEENVSTPADWKPGDEVVMGAPLTLDEADERLNSQDGNLRSLDWYLTMKKI
ncbi:peroxiredoxin [Eubacterium xylanophilum]|uniref:peroxiredoxin n=1 Tax=Eubacterium xylanophilum TaxID=39497 RepID=UPI0004B716E2|nr:peroxiredoxin [Eubacterium xylanophilum]